MISKPSVLCITMGLVLALSGASIGTAGAALAVEKAVIATGMEGLVPTGKGTTFPAAIGKLYCFSKVVGAEPPTRIKHVWYYKGRRMAEITLSIKHASHRTYSSKRIMPAWKGEWRVDILAENGTLLRILEFTVR